MEKHLKRERIKEIEDINQHIWEEKYELIRTSQFYNHEKKELKDIF